MCPKTELFAIKVETHFGSFCFARFMKKVLGAFSRFMCPKMKLFPAKFRHILEVYTLRGLYKKFWAHYHHFCVQKQSCLSWSLDGLRKFSPCMLCKKFWAQFHDLCVQKRSCLLWSSDAFRKFSPCEVYKTVLGTLLPFLHPKTKLFAVNFRRILDVLHLQGLQRNFWAHFHDLYVQKRSCFLWSSDAFRKFFACKFCRKNYGRIFTIYASKREAVCCEVQMHFASFCFARFMSKVLGAFLWLMRRIAKLFAAKFRRILEVLRL